MAKDTVGFQFEVDEVRAHSDCALLPPGEHMLHGMRVIVDDTIPPNEIRITSGNRLMVLKLKSEAKGE